MRRRIILAAALAVTAIAVPACSGSGGDAAAKPPKFASQSGATTIDAFDVPATVSCGTDTSSTVTVHYAVSNAAKQLLLVDGLQIDGVTKEQGDVTVPIHCDPLPHTFVLVAVDADGHRTSQQKILQVNP